MRASIGYTEILSSLNARTSAIARGTSGFIAVKLLRFTSGIEGSLTIRMFRRLWERWTFARKLRDSPAPNLGSFILYVPGAVRVVSGLDPRVNGKVHATFGARRALYTHDLGQGTLRDQHSTLRGVRVCETSFDPSVTEAMLEYADN